MVKYEGNNSWETVKGVCTVHRQTLVRTYIMYLPVHDESISMQRSGNARLCGEEPG